MPANATVEEPKAPSAPPAARAQPARPPPTPLGRKIYITFGGEVYDRTTAMIAMIAPKLGADETWIYDDRWLLEKRRDFVMVNRWLWDHPHKRGFGWYVWKPFVVLDALDRAKEGDVVLYTDADTCPIDELDVLYRTCAREGGIMLFRAGGTLKKPYRQGQWCKRDCFVVMNQDAERYRDTEAGVARFMLFQKGPWRARQFLMEWLAYCVNPLATTFDPSVLGAEAPGFVEHRTEQAIMTNLAHKYGVRLHREACELGNEFPEDKELYPQLFTQLNPWGNKTAPCRGSRFRNVDLPPAPPALGPADAATACLIARAQAAAGKRALADKILRASLERLPDDFASLVLDAQLREGMRDFPAALSLYERAIAVNPGHALPFTRRAIIRYRSRYGDPAAAVAADPLRPAAGMASLGMQGRFGNQLLQYGLLRLYAEAAGAQATAPDWIGRDLFGLSDPLPRGAGGAVAEEQALAVVAGGAAAPAGDAELSGFFCGETSSWSLRRDKFQSLFEPVGAAREAGEKALGELARRGRTLVAVHVRRGDFGAGRFWLAPTSWYLAWLEQAWPRWERPVLYLATDDASVAADFQEFGPVVAAELAEPLSGAEFFVDHWVLRHADHLAVSNSTFSVTAALLNRKSPRCLRPDRALSALREFDPWAEKVLLD